MINTKKAPKKYRIRAHIELAKNAYSDSITTSLIDQFQKLIKDRDNRPYLDELYFRLATRFRHYLLDEFQDTSRLQYQWLKMLTSPASFIFAVGDDDQSIYGFRGARPGNMKDLQKDFKIKNVIKLEQNYRSKNNILNAANSIIENNSDRLGKNLWTASGDGDLIKQYTALDDRSETAYILDEIKNKFEVLPATFKNVYDDVKLNVKINTETSPNDLLSFLTSKAEVHHFVEVIPSANDIFIQTVKNN